MANHKKHARQGARRPTSPRRPKGWDRPAAAAPPVTESEMRRALELTQRALVAEDEWEQLRLLREALDIHPTCIDANLFIVRHAMDDAPLQATALRTLAAITAADVLTLPEDLGLEPYLRLLAFLGMVLEDQGDTEECAGWLNAALELDPDDSHWNRYRLASVYLEAGRVAEAQDLLERWSGEQFVTWAYAEVLVTWLGGDEEGARAALDRAREANPGVEAYWHGDRELPEDLPTAFRLGGPEEAMWAGAHLARAWAAHPAACEWLRRQPAAECRVGRSKAATVPKAWRPRYAEIVEHTDRFCAAYLTRHFARTCAAMAARLCRDGSPVATGQAQSWAAGIVAVVASINCLDSRDPDFGLTIEQMARAIGVAGSTAQAKARQIKDRLRPVTLDPAWTPANLRIRNLKIWLVWADGRLVDLRRQPRELQELALEQGLIPFLPVVPKAAGVPDLGDFFDNMAVWRSVPGARTLKLD